MTENVRPRRMNDETHKVTHYAILIGINDYPRKPLKGCVRDVQDIKTYLESVLGDCIRISILTTSPIDQKSSDQPKASSDWPTYFNVTSAFEEVTSSADKGDYVYIHYSGHGTRKLQDDQQSDKTEGTTRYTTKSDLALVLLTGGSEDQNKYLWGSALAHLLKKMVDKGLIVSLTLDCCFSGNVYRRPEPSDPRSRFLPYEDDIGAEHPHEPEDRLWNEDAHPVLRDASMLPNWLINPDNYAILTACGPYEEAAEAKFGKQRSKGALSGFLLDTLEWVGLSKRHGDIYHRLRAKFQGYGLRQTPVLYGNRNQGFFGRVTRDIGAATVPIVLRKNDRLELQAGYAQGLKTDDQLVLYPLASDEGDSRPQDSVLARIVGTRAFTSDLEQIDKPCIHPRTGWIGRALTRLCLQRFPIRLASKLPCRDELLEALRERSLDVLIDMDEHQFAFDVVLRNGEYEILDDSGNKVKNLNNIPQDLTSVGQIGYVLEHLARFRFAKELVNEAFTDSFAKSFKVQIFANGRFFGADCVIDMEHNAIADLVVENLGDKELYFFVYDLGPCWQVENIYGGTYGAIMPRMTTPKKIRMSVPAQVKENGYRSCEDIVKVIVTSQPTAFDLLVLPRLGEQPKVSSEADRSGHEGDGLENWIAMNFPIHVVCQEDAGQ